jgi:hypothetical protein
MEFLFILLLIILILRLVPWIAVKWLRRKIRKATETEHPHSTEAPGSPKRKKIIDKNLGDYVDFEEME